MSRYAAASLGDMVRRSCCTRPPFLHFLRIMRLAPAYRQVAALNFASARHPGGGWLSGAHAQEESLARASGLVASIADDPMYARHAQSHDALYTSSAIYTSDVPVF